MKEERKKTALVLAGGGFPGYMYEIGCMTALDDFFADGFSTSDFDIYVGTSAGATVAALLANGVRPRRIFEDIYEDRESQFNFRRTDIYSFGVRETFPMLKKFFKSLIPIFRYYFANRHRFSTLDLLYMLQENLPSGIFSLSNFDRYLAEFFSQSGHTNDFRQLKRQLYIPATDVDTGRYDVFGEPGFDHVPISLAVTASSAMPIVFQPIRIGEKDYMDGAVGRSVHVDVAINHGADLFVIVNPVLPIYNDREKLCFPSFHGRCVGLKEKGMSWIFDQALRTSTMTRIYMSLKRYEAEYPEKDYMMLQPEPEDSVMYFSNVINLKAKLEVLQYGYASTALALRRNFAAYEKLFSKYGIRVNQERLQERLKEAA